jgi:hypothetical protein
MAEPGAGPVSFRGPTRGRSFAAVMLGDLVRDGDDRPWQVVGLGAAGSMTVQWVPGGCPTGAPITLTGLLAGTEVQLSEGPGWGEPATGEPAMAWAAGMVAEVLGGQEIDG